LYNRETPDTPYFLVARDNVPLKQEFKPALKVLSRKPAPELDPGSVTPPNEDGRQNRGKGRGGNRQDNRRPDSQSAAKELFDPNYTPKPGVTIQKRNGDSSRSGRSTPREEEQIIRKPRGPDASGGGGFANKGGKS